MPHIAAINLSLAMLVSLESSLPAATVDRLCPTLRPSDAWSASLTEEGRRRSATFRRLADRLATLKVIMEPRSSVMTVRRPARLGKPS